MSIKGDYLFSIPKHIDKPYGWVQHIPFAFYCIKNLKPNTFVELGTHSGNSYFAFCQAVEDLKVHTSCYAVDHWKGDRHSGTYDEEVFERVKKINRQHFHRISNLLRMSFDDAVKYFSDKSIDLLHIDGLHEYDAVKHDFYHWLPKISNQGVVLFHDTNVREREFGVWKLFEELAAEYKSTNFIHGHGLGVLCVGENIPSDFLSFVELSNKDPFIKHFYSTLGDRILSNIERTDKEKEIQHINNQRNQEKHQLAEKNKSIDALNRELSTYQNEVSNLNQKIENTQQVLEKQSAIINDLNHYASEYQLAIQKNTEREKAFESEIQKLTIEVSNKTDKIISLSKSLEELKNQSEVCVQENTELRSTIAVKKEVFKQYELLNLNARKEIDEHKDVIQSLNAKNNGLAERVELLQNRERSLLESSLRDKLQITELEKWNNKKDEVIHELESRILLVNEELLSKISDLHKQAKTVEDLEVQLQKSSEIIEQLRERINIQQERIDDYERSTTEQKIEIAALKYLINEQESAYQFYLEQKRKTEQLYKHMLGSFSWRITKPIRALQSLARSAFGSSLIRIFLFSITLKITRLKTELSVLRHEKTIRSSAFFDSGWYLETYKDVADPSNIDPVRHYLRRGAMEGRNPHPMFNTKWYCEQNPDVKANNINPLVHFILYGWKEGRNPSADCKISEVVLPSGKEDLSLNKIFDLFFEKPHRSTYKKITNAEYYNRKSDHHNNSVETNAEEIIIKSSRLFDESWYLNKYPDLRNKKGLNPIKHFLEHGAFEGRNPNALFETAWYLSEYPDVWMAGINPLTDYVLKGFCSKRNPNPLFNNDWYLANHCDVKLADMNPLTHYLHYGSKERRNVFAQEKRVKLTPKSTPSIAVICHLYYLDLWPELAYYIKTIPSMFDLFVSLNGDEIDKKKAMVLADFPFAQFKVLENTGRDVFPFHVFLNEISAQGYDLFCKIHSKRGHTEYGDLWRKTMLQGILGSRSVVTEIINAFTNIPDLGIVGPMSLYKSASALKYGNEKLVNSIWTKLFPGVKKPNDWGFFAGTMFWGRTEVFAPLLNITEKMFLQKQDNKAVDGQLAHALERIYGAVTISNQKKTGLVKNEFNIMGERSLIIVETPGKLCKETPGKTLSRFHEMVSITGKFNKKNETGIFNETQTHPLFKHEWYKENYHLNDKHKHDTYYYHLTKGHLASCSPHPDFLTNIIIPKNTNIPQLLHPRIFSSPVLCRIPPALYLKTFFNDEYTDYGHVELSDYLRKSISNPEYINKINENSFRLIAMMDDYKNQLHKKYINEPQNKLVSIIMPTYNRETSILDSIASVFMQTYTNWELIIINDAGSDHVYHHISQLNDKRIKYLKLSTNKGNAAARNHGLSHANGSYITYLDDDDQWDPDFLLISLNRMRELNKAFIYSATMIWKGYDPIWKTGRGFQYILFSSFNRSWLENRNYISIISCMHEATLIKDIKGFNEKLNRFVDWDFFIRLSEIEHPVSVPCILSHYYRNRKIKNVTSNTSAGYNIKIIRDNLVNRANGFINIKPDTTGVTQQCFGISDVTHKKRLKKLSALSVRNTSIIIPNYESLSTLELCLSSIHKFTDPDFEVIISDNNSSDSTKLTIQELCKEYPNTKLIHANSGTGFSFAVNDAIKGIDTSNDIVILNNDTIVTKNWLSELQIVKAKHPSAGMVVPRQVLCAYHHLQRFHAPNTHPDYEIDINISKHHKNVIDPCFDIDDAYMELNFAPLFCAFIPADTFNRIGELDSGNGPHYRSDRIICNTIRFFLGQKIIYTPHSKLYHLQGVATKEKSKHS